VNLFGQFPQRINNYFKYNHKRVALIWGSSLLLVIFYIDYQVAPWISLSIFHLLPVALITWFVSKEAGFVTCGLSAIAELITHLNNKQPEISFLVPYWNAVVKLMLFLFVSYLLSELHRTLELEKELARTDYTTGIANKRLFFELALLEIKKAHRYRHPLTVVYIDVDDFKDINDTWGHSVGDKFLKISAEAIKNNIRETDIIARIGGDEFVILLPGSGYDTAQIVINRVKKQLLLAIKHQWNATFSIGAVTFINPPNSVDEMLQKADHLMYLVKNNGKNQLKHKTSV
jgi:diguanylate cyclase (GGDEF)-like protein